MKWKYDWVRDEYYDPIDDPRSVSDCNPQNAYYLNEQNNYYEKLEAESWAKYNKELEERRKYKAYKRAVYRSKKLSWLGFVAIALEFLIQFTVNEYLIIAGIAVAVLDILIDRRKNKKHWPSVVAIIFGIEALTMYF